MRKINRHKVDLREFRFLLFEQLRLHELLCEDPLEGWSSAEAESVLAECARWAGEVIGPLNTSGDREACQLREGRVCTPNGFFTSWRSLCDAGWKQHGRVARDIHGREVDRDASALL